MLAAEVIAQKRDGQELSADQIAFLAQGLASGDLSDAQAGAFAMAVYLQGLSGAERVNLTTAMRDSGDVLSYDLPGPVVDKHSTGGVGDTVSLIAAPILASCGAYVPMISGRGLGHTGGTLDKLDAVPGYNTKPDVVTLKKVTGSVGCAIIGQTSDIAPADRRLYAIRDVTATVPTIDLIVPSILSKKLAAGLDALVLDVKVGSGAFMTDIEDARELASTLVDVANGAGCKTAALITDMNQPLASCIGNALEVTNAVEILCGTRVDDRITEVTIRQCADLLQLCGLAVTRAEGTTMARDALASGRAAEVFGKMISALGGPVDFVEAPSRHLAKAPLVDWIMAPRSGVVTAIETRSLGLALIELGGGRAKEDDNIDMGVGFDRMAALGDTVDEETPLARIHANSASDLQIAKQAVLAAFHIGQEYKPVPLIYERIG